MWALFDIIVNQPWKDSNTRKHWVPYPYIFLDCAKCIWNISCQDQCLPASLAAIGIVWVQPEWDNTMFVEEQTHWLQLRLRMKISNSREYWREVGAWKPLRSSSHGAIILYSTWMLWMHQNVKKSSSLGVDVRLSFPGRVFFIIWDCLGSNYFNAYYAHFSCKTPVNSTAIVLL